MDEAQIAGAVALLGEDTIRFVANLTAEEFAAVRDEGTLPDAERGAVLVELLHAVAALATHPYPRSVVGNLCIRLGGGESLVQGWLRRTGQTVAPTPTTDPVLAELRSLAIDLYPLLLMPRGDSPFGHWSGAAYQHPRHAALVESLRSDAAIGRLVPEPAEPNTLVMVYRSTGSAHSLQVEMLGEMLVGAAWDRLRTTGVRELVALEAAIDEVVAMVRAAALGKPATCPVFVAFAGLRLPDEVDELVLPFGRLRHARDTDRWLYPASLSGGLTSTDAAGKTTQIDYAGDVVLETSLPYRVQVEPDHDDASGWPTSLDDYQLLADRADTMALAAALTFDRPEVTVIGSTWKVMFDPLAPAPLSGHRDARSYKGMTAVAACPEEIPKFADWVSRIDTARTASVTVGIRRTLSSFRERNDAADSLVDAVIAWENVFGTGQGEITFRVSMAMARLLANTGPGREALFTEVKKLYRMRSTVVHGDELDPQRCGLDARRAREITLEMWRVLFRDEPELIPAKQRAQVLLLR